MSNLLSTLAPNPGATHYQKRIGRGRGSGLGQTAGKGHKGQIARSGGKVRRGFEGGQTPLSRRLPKFGFKAPFRVEYSVVNLAQLNKLDGVVGPEELLKAGIIHRLPVKILGQGELKKSLTVKAHKFSAKAKETIEKAGGKTEVIESKKTAVKNIEGKK